MNDNQRVKSYTFTANILFSVNIKCIIITKVAFYHER